MRSAYLALTIVAALALPVAPACASSENPADIAEVIEQLQVLQNVVNPGDLYILRMQYYQWLLDNPEEIGYVTYLEWRQDIHT